MSEDGTPIAHYGYDANGNRIEANGLTADHDAQDRLLRTNGTDYTYTAHGELQTRSNAHGTTRYTYDVLGNLTQVQQPDGTVIDYLIDGENRRIGKKVNGTLEQGFLYQDKLKPAAELDGQGNVLARFVYAGKANVPDYLVKGGRTYRIITDPLGSVRRVVDTATGEIAQRMEHDAWGNVTLDTAPGFQPFGYAGGLYDPDTKLVRFGARDYDPEVGRWTAKDPIGFAGGINLYAYVGGNPINYTDPTGLIIDTAWDIGNLIYDIWNGNWGDAAADAVAMCIPGVPAGITKLKNVPLTKGGPPRDPRTANYLPHPDAEGPHTVLGTRTGRNGDYTQGATFDANGNFLGRTDVTNHGRGDHQNPHWHPATGPNSVGSQQSLPW